jgi:glycosyltransferase involved in cell wall biosynthesis
MPKISVIVPVYNAEQNIRQCLDSLAFQTYMDFEAILVDDASLDRSGYICDEFAARNNRFKAIHHQETCGDAATRNTGLDHASGQYIAFVDAADYCHPDHLQVLVMLIERQQAGMATTELYDEGLLRQAESGDQPALFPHRGLFPLDVMRYGACCKLFVRDIIAENGLRFDEELSCGIELLFVASYLQFAPRVALGNKRTYYRRMTLRQALVSWYNLPKALAREAAIQKLTEACGRGRAATELLATLRSDSIGVFVYIAGQYTKLNQRQEAAKYTRKAQDAAYQLRRDAYASRLAKMAGRASLLLPRLYALYRQLFTVLLSQAVNKGLLSGDRTDKAAYVKGVVLALVLFFPFIRPISINFTASEAVINLYRISMALSLVAAFFLYLVVCQRVSKIMAAIALYCIWLFVPTHLYDGSMYECTRYAWYVTGFCLLTELFAKRNFAVLARSLLFILTVYVLVNLGTVIFYPDGLYVLYINLGTGAPGWFLGHYNRHTIYILPSVYLALLLSTFQTGKRGIEAPVLLAIGAVTVFTLWSANSVVAVSMMIVYVLILYSHANPRWFNYVSYALVSIAAFAFIAVTIGQPVVMRLYETLLDRGPTISGRVTLWGNYISRIRENPLLGYGVQNADMRLATADTAFQAHNTYIEHLYTGGLVGFALIMAVFVLAGIKLYRQRGHQLASILSFAAFVNFIIQIVEPRTDDFFIFQLFVIAYHIDAIIEQQEDYRLLNAQKGQRWVSAAVK